MKLYFKSLEARGTKGIFTAAVHEMSNIKKSFI